VKCKGFGTGLHYRKTSLFEVPAVFRAVQEAGGIAWREMFQIFNMGHRMEVYCAPQTAAAVIATANQFAVAAKVIGEVVPADKSASSNQVTISWAQDELRYSA
jgi:phosphoribosylformylglycinamidine cyclo-ligase